MGTDRCDLLCLDVPAAEAVRAAMPSEATIARISAIARSCADPTRLAVLLALDTPQELCVCDLTWVVSKPQNLVSHHLRNLREAGLVEPRREAKIVFYSLTTLGRQTLEAITKIEVPA